MYIYIYIVDLLIVSMVIFHGDVGLPEGKRDSESGKTWINQDS